MSLLNMMVSAPRPNASFAETMAFNIYANRQERIETLINELVATENPNDEWEQAKAFDKAGFLSADDLLDSEREYVEKEISRRWTGNF